MGETIFGDIDGNRNPEVSVSIKFDANGFLDQYRDLNFLL